MKRIFFPSLSPAGRLLVLINFIIPAIFYGQKNDTLLITAEQVNTSVLRPGMNRYLVYLINGKDSTRKSYELWTQTVSYVQYEGKNSILVEQSWEDKDTIFHTARAYFDRKNFYPFFQESWWKPGGTSAFDFVNKKIEFRGETLSEASKDTNDIKRWKAFNIAAENYFLNWHFDLQVFSMLPFKDNRTFLINFYDPGFATPPQLVPYSIIGSGELKGYNNSIIKCWLLQYQTKRSKSLFWISKETKEVLKLEQEFNGRYRYKIKLGFSN